MSRRHDERTDAYPPGEASRRRPMTRGKYGAKAAKRQETQVLEAEVAKLQHALRRTEKERDERAEKLRRLEVSTAAELRALRADVANGSSTRVRELETLLATEAARRATEAEDYARQVVAVFIAHNGGLPMAGFEELLGIFGQSHNLGKFVDPDGPRNARRGTVRKIRQVVDMDMAPEWAQAAAKAAGK
jgi:hypothetical protein